MTEKILIVDDDKEFRAELKECLGGYEIYEAANGGEALDLLGRAHEIDLVILDIKMPGPSGLDILSEIKKRDPEMGIMMLTGYSTKDTAIEALKSKADDYMEKPPDPEELRHIIEKILEKKRGAGDLGQAGLGDKIEKTRRFVARNCFKKTGLEEAARAVCLSPKYLSRVFRERTGENFVTYRIKVKMEKAKELLCSGGTNISQIAYRLGYENPESFIRQFKKLTKSTPSQYRKRRKRLSVKCRKSVNSDQPRSNRRGPF